MDFAEDLELELAWRKTKRDYSHYMNSFISSPYIIRVLDWNMDGWLADLRERLEEDKFDPRSPRIIDIPKDSYHLRPASVLHPEDLVVYSSYILECFEDLHSEIKWSEGECRFSHILREKYRESNQWDEFEKQHWKDMQDKKIDLAEESEYVLETDVSGFYENIDIERVTSIFKQMTARQDVGNEIRHLLRPWAEPRKRGVPQGYGPSDILAEIYLDGVDRRLYNHGFDHVRYNDDFYIFCDSRDAAIDAQNLLEREFRARGLNMKSGKTEIVPAIDALQNYSEPESIFNQLKEDIGEDEGEGSSWVDDVISNERAHSEAAEYARSMGAQSSPYSTEESDKEDIVNDGGHPPEEQDQEGDGEGTSQEITAEQGEHLEEAYTRFIEDVDFDDLDVHLFRFIINRLGKSGNPIAVDYCIEYVKDGRSDVRRLLYNYFEKLPNKYEVANKLAEAITDEKLRYRYHNFVVLRWFYEEGLDSSEIVHCARQFLERGEDLIESREYAMAILSEYGDYSDWEHIEMVYGEAERELTKAVIAYALRHYELGRRKECYSRIKGNFMFVDMSIETGDAHAGN